MKSDATILARCLYEQAHRTGRYHEHSRSHFLRGAAMTDSCDDEAKEFRAFVRGVAKLPCKWDSASDGMRDWYRSLAKRYGDKIGQVRK